MRPSPPPTESEVAGPTEDWQLMLEDVTDLDIRFATVDGNDLDWSRDWEGQQGLPVAVEISFELHDTTTYRRVIELPGGVPAGDQDDS